MLDTWILEFDQCTDRATIHYISGAPYQCPSCNDRFKYLSGLFRHAESRTCDLGTREIARDLTWYIRGRAGAYKYGSCS